jgi:hypothetical protein
VVWVVGGGVYCVCAGVVGVMRVRNEGVCGVSGGVCGVSGGVCGVRAEVMVMMAVVCIFEVRSGGAIGCTQRVGWAVAVWHSRHGASRARSGTAASP